METYEKWLEAFRLKMATFAILLVLSSFVLANKTIDAYVWLIVLIVTLGTINTMLTNDYFDREHDKLKGKTFASENEHTFLFVVVILWSIIFMLSCVVMFYSRYQGSILLICAFLGIIYSFTRKFPMLSAITVAFASSLVSQFPTEKTFFQDRIPIVLFSYVFLFILAREIVRDVKDKYIDNIKNIKSEVYKKTLPVILNNKETALIIAGCTLFAGIICSLFLIPFAGKFYVIWIPLLILSVVAFIFYPNKYAIGEKYLDIGILIMLFSFLYPSIFNIYHDCLDYIAYIFELIGFYYPIK